MIADAPEGLTTHADARLLRYLFDRDLVAFSRYFMKVMEGTRFIIGRHHQVIASFVERVLAGQYPRGIVTVPPGTTKTELVVKALIAREIGRNPRARFIHVSGTKDLVLRNSDEIRDVVASPEYQRIYPGTAFHPSVDSKHRWNTRNGGGLYAVQTGGPVIGFRAGRMEKDGFSGAIVIDDPHKPEDVLSDVVRKRQNARFNTVIRTRLARTETPVILIMQRLHEDDLAAFLLKGGSGDQWHHLNLPVVIDGSASYPPEYTHGIPVDHGLAPGLLWPEKYSEADLAILRADDYTYSCQYMQAPQSYGGGVFTDSNWKEYAEYIPEKAAVKLLNGTEIAIVDKRVYADTAMKAEETNDYSVFQCWGKGTDDRIYLLDQVRGRYEAPELREKFLRFLDRHEYREGVVAAGLRFRKVEDKASGTGLIQEINRLRGRNYITGIPRNRDKVSRARDATIPIARGLVVVPTRPIWIDEYRAEFRAFSPFDTHKNDDQIDPTLDAISDMLGESTLLERYARLAG